MGQEKNTFYVYRKLYCMRGVIFMGGKIYYRKKGDTLLLIVYDGS